MKDLCLGQKGAFLLIGCLQKAYIETDAAVEPNDRTSSRGRTAP